MVLFLDQTLKLSLPVISHPYMHSFLHRAIIVWVFAAVVMIAVSLLTEATHENQLDAGTGSFKHEGGRGLSDYRVWAAILFGCTVVLWWWFR